MLTSSYAQGPETWIAFEEARRIMLGWAGYKMVLIAQSSAEEWEAFTAKAAALTACSS